MGKGGTLNEAHDAAGGDALALAKDDRRAARAGRDDLNEAHFAGLALDLARLIELHVKQIGVLERQMARVGELLRISQPPGYGKYDVRWWHGKGQSRKNRVPVLAKWVQAAQSAKFKVVEVTRYTPGNERRDGPFSLCADETRDLVLHFLNLRKEYREVSRRLSTIRMTLDMVVRGAQSTLEESESAMDGLQRRVVSKLLASGYAVEARYRL